MRMSYGAVGVFFLVSFGIAQAKVNEKADTHKLLSLLFQHLAYTQELVELSGKRKVGYLTFELLEQMRETTVQRNFAMAMDDPYQRAIVAQNEFLENAKSNELAAAEQEVAERESQRMLYEAFAKLFSDRALVPEAVFKPLGGYWTARLKREQLGVEQTAKNLEAEEAQLALEVEILRKQGNPEKAIERNTAKTRLARDKDRIRLKEKRAIVEVMDKLLKEFLSSGN